MRGSSQGVQLCIVTTSIKAAHQAHEAGASCFGTDRAHRTRHTMICIRLLMGIGWGISYGRLDLITAPWLSSDPAHSPHWPGRGARDRGGPPSGGGRGAPDADRT